MKRSGLSRNSELFRRTAPKRTNGFAASHAQRERVRGLACVVCVGEPCDPAHLTPRSLGGCDHELCVIPLCRPCHRMFDEGALDIESVLALPQFAAERGHMAEHMSFERCVRRLRGVITG